MQVMLQLYNHIPSEEVCVSSAELLSGLWTGKKAGLQRGYV